ncbi:MAG: RNA methyltransferase [Eubacterium sp.]|nr:RNA methyltransferase [Eubacterium sp.]
MEKITSKTNDIIKDTKRLMTSSKARAQKGAFVLEGARLCFDVLNSVYKVETLFITEKIFERYPLEISALIDKSDKAYMISDEVSKKLSDTENPQGIFAVCSFNKKSKLPESKKIIALDNVQDPSNVGAIIRTAEALGIEDIIAFNCCDIYNPKTLRASMGSVLRENIYLSDNLEKTLEKFKGEYMIYSSVPSSSAEKITNIDFSKPSICVIGNEANGVEENIKSVSDKLITIPMLGNAESLNASVAASIIMWEMLR